MSKGVIKIGDFGFAKQNITKRIQNNSIVGTPLYMPLEILKSEPYTSKCDIWAVGFIFYQMLHGKGPWTASTEF
jgi:serine/threonine protein kinase